VWTGLQYEAIICEFVYFSRLYDRNLCAVLFSADFVLKSITLIERENTSWSHKAQLMKRYTIHHAMIAVRYHVHSLWIIHAIPDQMGRIRLNLRMKEREKRKMARRELTCNDERIISLHWRWVSVSELHAQTFSRESSERWACYFTDIIHEVLLILQMTAELIQDAVGGQTHVGQRKLH